MIGGEQLTERKAYLCEMPLTKSELRKMALAYRRMMSSDIYAARNESVCKQLLQYLREQDAKCVHLFLPILKNKEMDLQPILPELWAENRRVMVSSVDMKARTLTHFWLTKTTALVTNSWGIPEPLDAQEADFSEVDVVIVPLLLADRKGNRLGYGGGFYDRLLTEFPTHAIGISLAPPLDLLMQTEPHDAPLDACVFPAEIILSFP